MQIRLNGEQQTFEGITTLAQLVAQLGLTDKRIAVEVNDELVPRSAHDQQQLHNGDRIEIVQAIGGG